MIIRGRRIRARSRWESWVRSYTLSALARDMQASGAPVTKQAISQWISGACFPRRGYVETMVRLSQGRVRIADVYRHHTEVRNGNGSQGSPAAGPRSNLGGPKTTRG